MMTDNSDDITRTPDDFSVPDEQMSLWDAPSPEPPDDLWDEIPDDDSIPPDIDDWDSPSLYDDVESADIDEPFDPVFQPDKFFRL